jgi:heme/copper-type cytochrome/quinol oxidase subunit 4
METDNQTVSVQRRFDELTKSLSVSNSHYYSSNAEPDGKTVGFIASISTASVAFLGIFGGDLRFAVVIGLIAIMLSCISKIKSGKKRKNSS